MSVRMQRILAGAVLVLFLLVIVLVLLIQWGDDGAVLLSDDTGTLSVVATVVIALGYFIADTMKSRNFTDGYKQLIDKLIHDKALADTLESKYLTMPEGLPKSTVDLVGDMMKHVVKMTPTEADDRLAGWIDQVRDGVPNE